jgi:hypothetical protein
MPDSPNGLGQLFGLGDVWQAANDVDAQKNVAAVMTAALRSNGIPAGIL